MASPSTRGPDSHPELVWYFRWSAAEVGLHAQGIPECGYAIHGEPQPPSLQQMCAARRQCRVRRCLRALPALDQNILACAYEDVELPPNIVAVLGRPLACALRFLEQRGWKLERGGGELVCQAVVLAHVRFDAALRRELAEVKRVRETSSSERRVHDSLAEEGMPLVSRHAGDVLALAAWLREMGLAGRAGQER